MNVTATKIEKRPVNLQNIKVQLAIAGMSQRELARAVGKDEGTISLIITGKRTIKLSDADVIARALNIPIDELFYAREF